ncbi:MAG: hypothetical protein GEU95_20495 [Rhizobiales bacterium]|nr:hypothetical protein [Hyphomicrobiales bacterium]
MSKPRKRPSSKSDDAELGTPTYTDGQLERMNSDFAAAMRAAMAAGSENAVEGVVSEPGTRRPLIVRGEI